jgi:hypothetical protein
MGIFDVSMPIIYGEGERAFSRLLEEILRKHGHRLANGRFKLATIDEIKEGIWRNIEILCQTYSCLKDPRQRALLGLRTWAIFADRSCPRCVSEQNEFQFV